MKDSRKERDSNIMKAVVGLIKYDAITQEKLLNVGRGDYDKFTEKMSAKGVPDAICDLLFEKYVATKKRSASDESDGDRKRRCVKQNGDQGMEVFCRELRTGKRVVVGGAEFIQFKHELLGMSAYPEKLFVRECYKSLYDKVTEVLRKDKKGNVVTVMGTPGIGKTVFGLLVMHRLLEEGNTVMYYHGGEDVYFLFAPKNSLVIAAARMDGFEIPEPTETGYVGRITTQDRDKTHRVGKELVIFLEDQSKLYYVHDPPKGGIKLREAIRCNTIIVSSPHRGNTNTMKNQQILFYMPIWTREELALGNKHFGTGVTDQELQQRWDKFGGIARWVLTKDGTTGLQLLNGALAKLRQDDMKHVLDPFFLDSNQTSSLVVHMHPKDDFSMYSTRIATPQMFDRIRMRLKLVTNIDVQRWAETMQNSTEISMGTIMEQCWHNQFLFEDGVDGCTIRELFDDSVSGPTYVSKEKLDFTSSTTFGNRKMSDLHTLKENEYCKPESPNFETVDSFAALREPFCDPKNKDRCLVGFQMTAGKKKHLKLAGGRALRLKFKTLFQMGKALPLSNMYIVFVTTKSNEASFRKKVPWKNNEKIEAGSITEEDEIQGEFSGVRQFVLVSPDTATAAQRWDDSVE